MGEIQRFDDRVEKEDRIDLGSRKRKCVCSSQLTDLARERVHFLSRPI